MLPLYSSSSPDPSWTTENWPWRAGIDWLTLVTDYNAPWSERQLLLMSVQKAMQIDNSVTPGKPARQFGYEGTRWGKFFFGERADGAMAIAEGWAAGNLWQHVPWAICHATRIDLALTWWQSEYEGGVADYYATKIDNLRKDSKLRRNFRITHYKGFGDGDTLAIGSRSSASYARIYDKEKQSGNEHYKRAWRAEIEYKGPATGQIVQGLRFSTLPESTIARTVCAWCFERGVRLPVDPGMGAAIAVKLPRPDQDNLRRLAWLARSVAPTVAELICAYGREVVYSALFGTESAGECTELSSNNGGIRDNA